MSISCLKMGMCIGTDGRFTAGYSEIGKQKGVRDISTPPFLSESYFFSGAGAAAGAGAFSGAFSGAAGWAGFRFILAKLSLFTSTL